MKKKIYMANVRGVAWRGYRIYLQRLKIPGEVSSKPCEKERGEKIEKNDVGKNDVSEKISEKRNIRKIRRKCAGIN